MSSNWQTSNDVKSIRSNGSQRTNFADALENRHGHGIDDAEQDYDTNDDTNDIESAILNLIPYPVLV